MTELLIGLAVSSLAVAITFSAIAIYYARKYLRMRHKHESLRNSMLQQEPDDLREAYVIAQEDIASTWKVPPILMEDMFPVFADDYFGISRDCEARIIGGDVVGGTSTREAWIIAVLAKQAKRMFEFGTCTGRTTYIWALNSPADAIVTTLTLHPESVQAYQMGATDDLADTTHARDESKFTEFYYTGTAVEHKVQQLYGDSKRFDESPYVGQCDLVFVDGSHAYSYVVSDTCKALRLLKPGGVILWHDYRGCHMVRGVFQALNELSTTLPLVRIPQTSFVAYRRDTASSEGSPGSEDHLKLPQAWKRVLQADRETAPESPRHAA